MVKISGSTPIPVLFYTFPEEIDYSVREYLKIYISKTYALKRVYNLEYTLHFATISSVSFRFDTTSLPAQVDFVNTASNNNNNNTTTSTPALETLIPKYTEFETTVASEVVLVTPFPGEVVWLDVVKNKRERRKKDGKNQHSRNTAAQPTKSEIRKRKPRSDSRSDSIRRNRTIGNKKPGTTKQRK